MEAMCSSHKVRDIIVNTKQTNNVKSVCVCVCVCVYIYNLNVLGVYPPIKQGRRCLLKILDEKKLQK